MKQKKGKIDIIICPKNLKDRSMDRKTRRLKEATNDRPIGAPTEERLLIVDEFFFSIETPSL